MRSRGSRSTTGVVSDPGTSKSATLRVRPSASLPHEGFCTHCLIYSYNNPGGYTLLSLLSFFHLSFSHAFENILPRLLPARYGRRKTAMSTTAVLMGADNPDEETETQRG